MAWEEDFVYPLILLLIGAGVSGGLVALLTHFLETRRKEREIEVERKRKELEIKTVITSKMAEIMARLDFEVVILTYHKKKLSPEEKNNLIQIEKSWYIDTRSVLSKLEAYFPDTNIRERWDVHLSLLDTFAVASRTYFDPDDRHMLENSLYSIKENLSNETSINSQLGNLTTTFDENLWNPIRQTIRRRGDKIIEDVLNHCPKFS
jgi:hypothetical protein